MWKQNFILATFTFLFISTIGIKAQSKSHVVTDIHYLYGLSETGTGLAAKGRKGSLVAIISGVKSENVIFALSRLTENKRKMVQEMTLDLSLGWLIFSHNIFCST